MADVSSSAPVSGVNTSGGGGGGGASASGNYQSAPANIVNLPDNLQSISQNITLGARLVATNSDGSVVLGTAQGNITLQTPFQLSANTPLQLQFQAGSPPTAVLVLFGPVSAATQINNTEQTVEQNTSSFEFNSLSQVLASIAPGGASNLQQGTSVAALVIGNLPDSSAANLALAGGEAVQASGLADSLEELASGNNSLNNNNISEQIKLLSQFGAPGQMLGDVGQLSLSGKLLTTIQQTLQQLQAQPGGTLGAAGSTDALKVLLQQGQGGAGLMAAPGSPNALVSQQTILANLASGAGLSPGTPLSLKILAVLSPGQSLVGAALPPGTQTLSGQISSQTLNNLPLLQTPQGTLVLQAANKFPPGTTLVFELPTSLPLAAAQAALQDAAKTNPVAQPPKLEQMLQLLAQTDGETFSLLLNNMPRLNGQLPPTALFFMQAMQTGDLKNWLGSKGVDGLRRAGPMGMQLLGELEEEFKTASGRANNTKPGEWRLMNIPYLGEYGITSMQFGVRNHFQAIDPDERRKFNLDDNAGRVTRFIFDIQFSELGPMQVDGLLRPRPDYSKQLDVLLRTRELLPADMRRDLRDLFSESLGAYGMNGVLTFQAGHQNWISLTTARQSGHAAHTRV